MSSLEYPWPETPTPGTTLEVAPGVRWLSMPHPMWFAMGEAIAHLHRLYYAGRARRTLGADGVMRYARA